MTLDKEYQIPMTNSIRYPCQGRRNNDGLGSGSHGKGRAEDPENRLHPKIVFTPKQKMRDAANAVELSIDKGSVKSSTGGGTTTNPDESETENPLG